MGLRDRAWKRFLKGPDQALLTELYEPALAAAVRYDRCCGYFSSSVLAAAARGFGPLIEHLTALGDAAPRPAVRLVVNEELTAADVAALTETGDLSRLEALLLDRLVPVEDLLQRERLGLLTWLTAQGLLEVKVGVMRHGGGIVHAKYGLLLDAAGDAVVFSGSDNETAQGVQANYEHLEVSTSWGDPERFVEYRDEFARLWADTHPDVHTVPLPEAVRLKLISLAPPEPPLADSWLIRQRQGCAMLWRFLVEAPYLPTGGSTCDAGLLVDLWPHQRQVVEETAAAWPAGRLLCDEVGMGKTVEALAVLRRLLAGRGVRRTLLLLPAGLLRQWQAELREKGGLVFPRLDGPTTLVWPDGTERKVSGLAEALQEDGLLLSRELARLEANQRLLLEAEPWDLVLLDEAHAARRKQQVEGEFNSGTLLLDLLRNLQLQRRTRSVLLLSATPMQTQPWEPWDLLAVLGEGGRWLAEFGPVRDFYGAVAAVQAGRRERGLAQAAAELVAADPLFPPAPAVLDPGADLAQKLWLAAAPTREPVAAWLRRGAPLGRRMHRNTRATLVRYHAEGRLAQPPARREVTDWAYDFADPAERELYDSITDYIERRFNELEQEKPGKGFVMTIYRRRAASSPQALQRSLERRRAGLVKVSQEHAVDPTLGREDVPEDLDPDELPEGDAAQATAGLPTDAAVARAELAEVDQLLARLAALAGQDSKREEFYQQLGQVTNDGRAALVFTEYTDTLEYLADYLLAVYGQQLACYSGTGGRVYDGQAWQAVTKSEITERLRTGQLRVLLCTDAASEGLNLQAAGALINYDLPWNPSKVEQRIGRIDRIGQQCSTVRIRNLFLKDSIDDRVYGVLRARCGLFQHFVGSMQPVLARAGRMLHGQEPLDLVALDEAAAQVEADPLFAATYGEQAAGDPEERPPAVRRDDVRLAWEQLDGRFGPRTTGSWEDGLVELHEAGQAPQCYGLQVGVLERDATCAPLSLLDRRLRAMVDRLERPGEHLPLVVAAARRDGFRVAVAYWIEGDETRRLDCFNDLYHWAGTWDGSYPDPERWQAVLARAQEEARGEVERLVARAEQAVAEALERQVAAAAWRLKLELGRYLVCLGGATSDLNGFWHRQMSRAIAGASRLREAYQRLGGWPEWEAALRRQLEAFAADLKETHRKARLAGSELDAALADPRWMARNVTG